MKHGDGWRQRGDFVGGMLALHRHPHTVLAQRAGRPLGEVGQRGEGAGGDDVVGLGDRFNPGMHAAQVRQAEHAGRLLDKRRLLGNGIDTGNGHFRAADGDDDAGQATARAHIQHARRPALRVTNQRRDDGQAVEQVVRQHLGRVAHGGQVVNLVPLGEQIEIRQQLRVLRGRETQAKRSGAFGQALLLRVAHAALATAGATPVKPLKPPFFKWISSKEMAAGVTPLMRPACPSVSGRCFCSFCRTSMDRAGICT